MSSNAFHVLTRQKLVPIRKSSGLANLNRIIKDVTPPAVAPPLRFPTVQTPTDNADRIFNIVIAGDKPVYEGIAVLLNSIFYHVPQNCWHQLNVYIVSDSMDLLTVIEDLKLPCLPKFTNRLHILIPNEDLIQRIQSTSVFKQKGGQDMMQNANKNCQRLGVPCNMFNFIRFYFHDILPSTVDKVLYLDTDMLVLNDIREVFTYLKDTYDFGAVYCQNPYPILKNDWLSPDAQRDFRFQYDVLFNGGMFLTYLQRWPRLRIMEKAEFLMARNKQHTAYYNGGTQAIMNLMCTNTCRLPNEWNQTGLGERKEPRAWGSAFEPIYNNAKIMHWTGKLKPWQYDAAINPYNYYAEKWYMFHPRKAVKLFKLNNALLSSTSYKQTLLPSFQVKRNDNLWFNMLNLSTKHDLYSQQISLGLHSNVCYSLLPTDITIDMKKSVFVNRNSIPFLLFTEHLAACLAHNTEWLEKKQAICWPSSRDLSLYENKIQVYDLFSRYDIKYPDTFIVASLDDINRVVSQINFPVVLKHPYSCSSQFMQEQTTVNSTMLATTLKQLLSSWKSAVIVQRKLAFTTEARLTCVGGKLIHGYFRRKQCTAQMSAASNMGGKIDFSLNIADITYKQFAATFYNKTHMVLVGIDIAWENDDYITEPFCLEVSPIFDVNPTPPVSFAGTYAEFKKTEQYHQAHHNEFVKLGQEIRRFYNEFLAYPIIFCDIDNTINNAGERIKRLGLTPAAYTNEAMMQDQPLPGAVYYNHLLCKQFQVIFLTARGQVPNAYEVTKKWLTQHAFNYDKIHIVNNADDKLNVMKSYSHVQASNMVLIDDFMIHHEKEDGPILNIPLTSLLDQHKVSYITFNNDWKQTYEQICALFK